ncbi:DUF7331 family protein [Haloplanus ruber]|uniref:Uncharacterized protein n=1 Tax=Haloplanus ruber TaxID=869892 RepID=A0ABD6CWD4_9EURY|nr:hypothetical protein [Haloplanus ruber]
MENRSRSAESARDPAPPALDWCAGYEDGDAFVVCDRRNARAWLRSETVVTLDP